MTPQNLRPLAWIAAALLCASPALATNPLIMDQFTADPAVRLFDGKLYLYASHDIKAPPEYKGRPNWFVMEDYHVFSSDNLNDWKDHGVIVTQTAVEWANPTAYSMWAPDCVTKNGKYYFYFPTSPKAGRGFQIGVAISDKPTGPFTPEPTSIAGVAGIDPCVLIDKDGSAYLYYSMNRIFVAKLKDNMTELASPPEVISQGLVNDRNVVEGPFVFERNGIYYLTYPHSLGSGGPEDLEYATGPSPTGPFTPKGVIIDQAKSGCWTVHQSILEYKGQWYLFYHDKDLSPKFDKNRAVRADKLFFNADGTIQKVIPTLRGVGVVDAKSNIQIDRYSAMSDTGASVAFLNEENPHAGWKVAFAGKGSWVQFNEVDFGSGGQKAVNVRSSSATGGAIEIHLDKPDGPLVAKVAIEKNAEWKTVQAKADRVAAGVHNLVVTQAGEGGVELDWISFE